MVPHVVSQQPLSGKTFRAVRTLKSLTYRHNRTQTKGCNEPNQSNLFFGMFNERIESIKLIQDSIIDVSACLPPQTQPSHLLWRFAVECGQRTLCCWQTFLHRSDMPPAFPVCGYACALAT